MHFTKHSMITSGRTVRLCVRLLLPIALLTGQVCGAQSAAPSKLQANASSDYLIGPGDILAINVTDAPEFSGKFRVDQSGRLEMASLPSPMQAQGKTPTQVAKDLSRALEDSKLYRSPTVNIFVDEYHSQTVTVVGAVAKPSVYPLQKQTTLLELISQAGGLLQTAGNKVTILPKNTVENGDQASASPVKTIDLAKLVRGENRALNVEVHDGEVVNVSSGSVVYVVGAVVRPGGFIMPDQSSGVTALQSIALAQGMTNIANSRHGLIIRRSADGTLRENIPIDLRKLMSGKTSDVQLDANDILFVPTSGSKQTLHAMGEAAMSAVNGIAIYGAGYRVAGI